MMAYSASKAAVIGMTKVSGQRSGRHRCHGERVSARGNPDPDGTRATGRAGEIHDRQDPDGSLR
jgi:NAD(P)-dependent dehydrogenase (short-subunit alcohol dehydrogenase family)